MTSPLQRTTKTMPLAMSARVGASVRTFLVSLVLLSVCAQAFVNAPVRANPGSMSVRFADMQMRMCYFDTGPRRAWTEALIMAAATVLVAPALAEERTVSLKEFYAMLADGQVAKAIFEGPLAVSCTAKLKDGNTVRVGEGYPVETPTGSGSPLFVVATVRSYKVPYEFDLSKIKAVQQTSYK